MATKSEINKKKEKRKSEFLELSKSIDEFLDMDLINRLKGEFEDLVQGILDYGCFSNDEEFSYEIITKKRIGYTSINLDDFEEEKKDGTNN